MSKSNFYYKLYTEKHRKDFPKCESKQLKEMYGRAERLSRTYGIRSTELDWLRSYLCDRRQTILFDGVFSTVRSLSCGVPQGSVLGPLLFLLYTADLGELAASLGLSSHFYADDSQLYTWGPPSTVAQQRRRM